MGTAKSPSISDEERIAMLRSGKFGFGTHFGKTFNEVPISYILWILREEPTFQSKGCAVMLCAVEEIRKYVNS